MAADLAQDLRKVGKGGKMHLAGSFYHVYNRGCNREPIFRTANDYSSLLQKAQELLPDYPLSFLAHCLMPNHYHFLLRPDDDKALSAFIQRLFNSYSQRFNHVWQRSGTLFEGRAQSVLVDSEAYLLHLCRYIHLNPVTAGLVQRPGQWPYSNYREWVGLRRGNLYDAALARSYFRTARAYEEFVLSKVEAGLESQLQPYYLD